MKKYAILIMSAFLQLINETDILASSKTIGFIIPTYISNQRHYNVLKEGIKKIRQYHDWPIVVINDHSPIDISTIAHEFSDIFIELSHKKGAGEMNPYWHYYHNKYFDTAIIIHDSTHLIQKLKNIEDIKNIKLLHHITAMRSWGKIKEPETDYNKKNNIIVHDDLVKYLFDLVLHKKNINFYYFLHDIYDKKTMWVACLGVQSIITWNFLYELQEKTNILDFCDFIKNRRDRVAMESIFPLACHYVGIEAKELSNSYDGIWIGTNWISKYTKKITLGR